jgi:drug/metabolite transporter (DMT)-like permease
MATIETARTNAAAAATKIPTILYIALFAGVLSASSAGVISRYALGAGTPPLVVAAMRVTLAALFLTPFALRHLDEIRQLRRRDLILIGISGIWMGAHFALWVASLEHVGVLIATVLVTSSPIWTAILEITFLKVRLTQMIFVGLIAVIIGNILIAAAGNSPTMFGDNPTLGVFMAISASIAIAIQRVIGRGIRMRLSVIPFLWMLYGSAGITLLSVVLITGTSLVGYSPDAYLWMVLLTLFPQLIGHSSYNFALRYIPATQVALAVQVQPVIAAFAALILFAEIPTLLQVIGSAVIILGVLAATLGRNIPLRSLLSRPHE